MLPPGTYESAWFQTFNEPIPGFKPASSRCFHMQRVPLYAAAFSWTFTNFTVVVPGALAALALTFAHYLAAAVPGWDSGGFEADASWRLKGVACAAVGLVCMLNCMSAAQGGAVAKVFLTATLSGCLFVVVLGVVFACGGGVGGGGDDDAPINGTGVVVAGDVPQKWGVGYMSDSPDGGAAAHFHRYAATDPRSVAARNFSPSHLFEGTKGFASLGVGLISALWAYSGAMDIASMAEELRDAERALPKVGTSGLAVVSLAYVLMNVAYLLVLPADVIEGGGGGGHGGGHGGGDAGSGGGDDGDAMGVVFARAVAGHWAGVAVTCVVALSSFGALNSCLYLSARQFYATARDGLFPAMLTHTNAKGAPYGAILATGAWTIALITVMSSFATLVNYLSAAMWLFYGLVGVAVMVSRRREPDAARPYQVPGYPVVPCVYVVVCACLSGCTFVAAPLPCAAALLFVCCSLPIHWVCFVWLPRRRARRSAFSSMAPGGAGVTSPGGDDASFVEPLLHHDGGLPPSQYGPVS